MNCRVEFHTGLVDPLAFACRLLRKAHRQGHRVIVLAPEPVLAKLDALLWTFEPESFLPHVRVSAAPPLPLATGAGDAPGMPADLRECTPVWLCESVPAGNVPGVLVNMGAAAPITLDPFERVIEIVSHDVDEAQAGRERWRAYKALGLEIVHHQAGAVGGARD